MAERLYEILPRNPTLFNLASKELVILLWKNISIIDAVNDGSWKFYAISGHFVPNSNFDLLTNRIVETLRSLLLNELLTLEVSYLVKPIGIEMCIWISENSSCTGYLKQLLDAIIWSRTCQINREASIFCFIGSRNVMKMFNRACHYCVVKLIPYLWIALPHYAKYYYRNISDRDILMSFWIHTIERKLDEFVLASRRYCQNFLNPLLHDAPNLRLDINRIQHRTIAGAMVYFAVVNSNCYAVKYFLSNFRAQNRSFIAKLCILVALKYNFVTDDIVGHEYADVVFELYFHLNMEDEINFLRYNSTIFILMMIKYYRYRNFLTSTIEKAWCFIDVNTYAIVVEYVFKGIKSGQYLERGLLRSVWNVSPFCLKRDYLCKIFSNIGLYHVFKEENFYITEVLLRDVCAETRNWIFSFFEI